MALLLLEIQPKCNWNICRAQLDPQHGSNNLCMEFHILGKIHGFSTEMTNFCRNFAKNVYFYNKLQIKSNTAMISVVASFLMPIMLSKSIKCHFSLKKNIIHNKRKMTNFVKIDFSPKNARKCLSVTKYKVKFLKLTCLSYRTQFSSK